MSDSALAIHIARGYLNLGMTSMARQTLEEFPIHPKSPPEAFLFLLSLYQDGSCWEKLQDLAERLIRSQPKEPAWWIYKAMATRYLDSVGSSEEILKEAENHFPLNGRIQLQLACCASCLNRLEEACQRLARAVLLDARLSEEAKAEPDLEPVWQQFFFAEFEPGWGRPEGGYRLGIRVPS